MTAFRSERAISIMGTPCEFLIHLLHLLQEVLGWGVFTGWHLRSSDRKARGIPAGPGPLKVISAEPTGYIDYFADEK